MRTSTPTADDLLTAGHEALARADWPRAREHFEAALEADESGAAYDGLAWAAWYVADEATTLRAREQAHRLHRAAGDCGAAAQAAAWLGSDIGEFCGEDVSARGWLERAWRLLDEVPEGAAHGWVALIAGSFATADGDAAATRRHGARAAHLGRTLGNADLEAIGLAQEGQGLIALGDVEEGTRRLDEAAAIAATERFEHPVSPVWTLCCGMSACDALGDFTRTAQWSNDMRAWSTRYGVRQGVGICRTSYGRVLLTRGDWPAADDELTAAVGDLTAARPGMVGIGLVRLAELRARQGRTEEAREMFTDAQPHPLALVGLGELALRDGDAEGAADVADRVLRRLGDAGLVQRMPALELCVRASAAAGSLEHAALAAAALAEGADTLGTPYLRGRACLAAAELAAASEDHEGARREAEDAVDLLTESAAPYDAALARLVLARSLVAAGREAGAREEATAARATFELLGAAYDVERADALLAAGTAGSGPPAGIALLTARETEVLRLVAQGLSDAEIAERLVLSAHTVHRHVANVRTKLRLPSRAASVAYAVRAGVL